MSQQIDLNNTRCIVEKSHFGYDTFVNICSGKNVDVPWTIGDWANFWGLVLTLMFVAAIVGWFGWFIYRESRQ